VTHVQPQGGDRPATGPGSGAVAAGAGAGAAGRRVGGSGWQCRSLSGGTQATVLHHVIVVQPAQPDLLPLQARREARVTPGVLEVLPAAGAASPALPTTVLLHNSTANDSTAHNSKVVLTIDTAHNSTAHNSTVVRVTATAGSHANKGGLWACQLAPCRPPAWHHAEGGLPDGCHQLPGGGTPGAPPRGMGRQAACEKAAQSFRQPILPLPLQMK